MQETLVKKIMLDEFALVKDFIHDTQSEETEVTVRCGKYVVDGKSIIGIFSLDLSKYAAIVVVHSRLITGFMIQFCQ